MPRTCEESIAARAWASKPRAVPAAAPVLWPLAQLLTHPLVRPVERRAARAEVAAPHVGGPGAALLAVRQRLQALVAQREAATPPAYRHRYAA
ncbi:hypothetical protein [Hymenobacter nivis]|uniref:Uncharacterized protein n=1 Tax=Hymenobacter nivis TaxID=1850093 RepID=A0A502GW33_9BACT|nr:hypothetical protein [Hymenobacter nivis]TPG66094.1 hypothetical protein EAH73_12045 [Hymenobacter nivis]